VFLNLLGNLAFPLLLVGGLFLLSRRGGGAGGMGGPGGNNPLAFGKSKARFQVRRRGWGRWGGDACFGGQAALQQ
jgi:cell division protease FtsH